MKNREYTVKVKGIEKSIRDFIAAQLKTNSVPVVFPGNIRAASTEGRSLSEGRRDLRGLPIFTIDCDTTQDRDDAVSIIETSSGYSLGVHIADVAAYAPLGSVFDAEAVNRGTSIYLPGLTVPMLPESLSNDLCSLNPDEDRCVISILIDLSETFDVKRYSVCKSLIRSRVKGTYSEVNDVLLGCAGMQVREKYVPVEKEIFVLRALSEALREKRRENGARMCGNDEVIADIAEGALTLKCADHGPAGQIIEEVMVLANALMAKYYDEHSLPAVYRAQDEVKQQAYYTYALRGHAELALSSYMHFTSPIRRLADLKNHQILSMYLDGCSPETIRYLFEPILEELCTTATKRARRAAGIQLACRKYCIAKYFEQRSMGRLSGTVSGYDSNGLPMVTLSFLPIVLCVKRDIKVKVGDSLTVEVRLDLDKKPYACPCMYPAA